MHVNDFTADIRLGKLKKFRRNQGSNPETYLRCIWNPEE